MGSAKWRVGCRFHPTEEELVKHYMKRKMEDDVFEDSDIMPEIDVCKYDPWNLPEPDFSCNAMESFFFSPLDYKYRNSNRFNRRTPSGYWKPTGEPRIIKDRRSNAIIGRKRTLTFYRDGQPKSKQTKPIAKKTKPTASKTNWVMHQYDQIESANPELVQSDFVLCRVKQKPDKDTSICEGELSSYTVPNHEYQPAAPEYCTSSAPQSPEPGVLLQANGINNDFTQMQFPLGDNNHFVTNKNDISTCDEGGSRSITVSHFHNEAVNDMFPKYYTPSAPESPELGVLQANGFHNDCTKMQSPFGDNNHFVTDTNDISTCDEGGMSITMSDFQNEVAYDMFYEPYHGHDYCSSTTQSPLYTNHGNVLHDSVHNQERNMQKSTFCDNRSIIYDEQDNHTAEVHPQPENLALDYFCQDYTLLPQVNTNEGDVLLDNNYIVCSESYSPIWST